MHSRDRDELSPLRDIGCAVNVTVLLLGRALGNLLGGVALKSSSCPAGRGRQPLATATQVPDTE